MSQVILFVGGGLEALPAVRLAKEMGLYTVVSDMDPGAPAFQEADDALIASTYDIDDTVAKAVQYHRESRPIDGVMCVASDIPKTVAAVADALGLPGISLHSAELASDKLLMKEKFAQDQVPIPFFQQIYSFEELQGLIAERGLPLIIKPVDSRGARGVYRLRSGDNFQALYLDTLKNSPTGRVMVEAFLPGPQVSTESLVVDGIAYTLGFSDRNYEFMDKYAPSIIENGGELPSFLGQDIQEKVKQLVQHATDSLGVKNGVVKGDIVVTDGVPHVIEMAARLSGGYFCTHEIPLNTGVDFVGNAIRLALGMDVKPERLVPTFNIAVAQRYIFPKSGTVTAITNADQYLDHPDVKLLEVRVSVGDQIGPINSHPARAGVVITIGKNVTEAVALAEKVVSSIKIDVE